MANAPRDGRFRSGQTAERRRVSGSLPKNQADLILGLRAVAVRQIDCLLDDDGFQLHRKTAHALDAKPTRTPRLYRLYALIKEVGIYGLRMAHYWGNVDHGSRVVQVDRTGTNLGTRGSSTEVGARARFRTGMGRGG